MLNDKVLLLQNAYKTYSNKFDELQRSSDQPVNVLRSLRSFTYSLKSAIGECIIFSTVPGKLRYGTMLTRYGTDVCSALHMMLFNDHNRSTPVQVQSTSSQPNMYDMSLSCISGEINQQLASSAKQIIAEDKHTSYHPET